MLGLILWLAAVPLTEDLSFQEGVRRYEQVDLDGAIPRFQQALAAASTDADRAAAHVWIALCHAQLGHKDEATGSFRAAVRLDAQVKLPALAPPDVEAMLEAARAELPRAPAEAPATPTPEVAAPSPPAFSPTSTSTSTSTAAAGPAEAPAAVAASVPMMIGGSGVVVMLAGAATIAVGMDTALRQAPEQEFNDDGRALRDAGYLLYPIGGAIMGVGAAALGVAAFMAAND